MNTVTDTQVKLVDNSIEVLNQFAIELDLETILEEESEAELASDINNAF